jgi:hypothetical protein
MTPTFETLFHHRLERVLQMLRREAQAANENHKNYPGHHWDSYAQGVEFSILEIRATMGMEESDELSDV